MRTAALTVLKNLPKVGIRPTIDDRLGGVRESLESQTMTLAKAAANLISQNLRHPNGENVACVIADTCIGGVAEAAACADKFARENVGLTLTVTPCWCYGGEAMDKEVTGPRAVWGFNGVERPDTGHLASFLAHSSKPAMSIFGRCTGRGIDCSIPENVAQQILSFTCYGLAAATVGYGRGRRARPTSPRTRSRRRSSSVAKGPASGIRPRATPRVVGILTVSDTHGLNSRSPAIVVVDGILMDLGGSVDGPSEPRPDSSSATKRPTPSIQSQPQAPVHSDARGAVLVELLITGLLFPVGLYVANLVLKHVHDDHLNVPIVGLLFLGFIALRKFILTRVPASWTAAL